jgi:hypothetical protein
MVNWLQLPLKNCWDTTASGHLSSILKRWKAIYRSHFSQNYLSKRVKIYLSFERGFSVILATTKGNLVISVSISYLNFTVSNKKMNMITWISIGLSSVFFFIPAWTKLRPSKENWFKGRPNPKSIRSQMLDLRNYSLK